jgi:hypothetical protein
MNKFFKPAGSSRFIFNDQGLCLHGVIDGKIRSVT